MNTGTPREFRVKCVRHNKRGTHYDLLTLRGNVQAASPIKEGDEVAIYVDQDDEGEVRFWVRPHGEFTDGRFSVAFREHGSLKAGSSDGSEQ